MSEELKSSESGSFIGDEITYPPLAHLPRSITRQRSLQNGNSGSEANTIFLQVGQRRLRTDFFGIASLSGQLNDSCDQIVLVCFGNLAAVEFALADILVISSSAQLSMPEVRLGIVSDGAPLRRYLSDSWVRRMCLLGEAFTATELQLDGAGASLCEPGRSEQVATEILESLDGIERSLLEQTKRRLAE